MLPSAIYSESKGIRRSVNLHCVSKTKRLAMFYQVRILWVEQYHMPLKALRPHVGALPDKKTIRDSNSWYSIYNPVQDAVSANSVSFVSGRHINCHYASMAKGSQPSSNSVECGIEWYLCLSAALLEPCLLYRSYLNHQRAHRILDQAQRLSSLTVNSPQPPSEDHHPSIHCFVPSTASPRSLGLQAIALPARCLTLWAVSHNNTLS